MEAQSYHFELNQLVEDIDTNLFLKGVTADRYELEFKAAYLKSCKDVKEYKTLQSKSILRPVIINQLKNARNFKVNALCENALYQNAVANVEKLANKSKVKNGQNNLIFLKWQEDKYFYDSKDKSWKSIQKDQLFERQYDVLSNKKLFRINLSVKTEKPVALQEMKDLMHKKKNSDAFLRFKRIICCRHYELFDIDCSTIFETENDEEVKLVKSWVQKYGGDISTQIGQKIESQKKKKNTKHELQLKFNEKGIEFLKKCEETQMKKEISKEFNLLRDITDEIRQQQKELTAMMGKISLQETKQKKGKQIQGDKNTVKDKKAVKQQQEQLQFIVRRK